MANPEDLGRYRLKRLLGRGTLGEVWAADDLERAGEKVAVKIMHAADDELAFARDHFAREARLASLMRHPNVVAVHDAGEAAGTSFLVMDMVEGPSLRTVLTDPSTTTDDKLRWLREIADGLGAMHAAGIVHRDVKPENVIIRSDRSACLVDLGIAKWAKFDLGGELDPADMIEELPPPPPSDYLPPETTTDSIYDELGDQYAWAVVAHEVLTGKRPTADSTVLATRKDVPAAVASAIDRARSPERDDRWGGMDQLLAELTGEPLPAPPPPESEPPPARRPVALEPAAVDPAAIAFPDPPRKGFRVLLVAAVVLVCAAVVVCLALR